MSRWRNWLRGIEPADHVMTAHLYDADDNRPGDQKERLGVALGTLQVLDNDTVAPGAAGECHGQWRSLAGPLDRNTAAWTNQPEFRVRFQPSVDGEPAGTDLEKTGSANTGWQPTRRTSGPTKVRRWPCRPKTRWPITV
jgi:hypothetical protein